MRSRTLTLPASMAALALAGPTAYAISVWRIRRQRHLGGLAVPGVSAIPEWIARRLLGRTRPFRSARHAVRPYNFFRPLPFSQYPEQGQ